MIVREVTSVTVVTITAGVVVREMTSVTVVTITVG